MYFNMETATENIELRSEKIRHIIGHIPPLLIRSGIGIISGIVFLLIFAACYIPYPETVSVPMKVVRLFSGNKGNAFAFIPYSRISAVKPGMEVEIQFEGYNANTYGYAEGTIYSVHREVISSPSGDCFLAEIVFRRPARYSVVVNQKGAASVCLSNESLMEKIFK